MDFDSVLKNAEKRINELYNDYKDQAKYINNIESADKLMQLECKKINNYFFTVIEEISLGLSQEIANKFGVDKSEKFRNIRFFTEKVSPVTLKREDIYETITETKRVGNKIDKKNNATRNVSIVGGGTAIGATGGWIIAEGTGLVIGGVLGLAVGLTAVAITNSISSENNNKRENTHIVEKKVEKFNKKKLERILEEREHKSKDTITKYVMNIKKKYKEFCEGC